MKASLDAVPALRALAVRAARRWGLCDDTEWAVRLIVTELVSNSVRHSGSHEVALLMTVLHDLVEVRVYDQGRWREGSRTDAEESECGRGLALVEAYADHVELHLREHGTTVLARLRADRLTEAYAP
ncbi:ATP-binding protein [Streptomyces sp. NPDC004266]|uniref:ATP-binding protein n=1 Tax=Streptomyces sp. NPDC004266 TaxID=3364693 RepID=UPI0036C882E8